MIRYLTNLSPRKALLLISGYLILIFLVVVFADGCYQQKKEARRHYNNFLAEEQSRKKLGDGYARSLMLTQQEYESRYGHIVDSLRNVHGKEMAKLKRIVAQTRIQLIEAQTNIRIQWRDSLIAGLTDTVRVGRIIKSDHPCIKVKVYQPDNDSAAYLTYGFLIDGELFIYKGNRSKDFKIFGKRIFRYGERSLDAKLFVNCGDSTKVNIQHIEVLDGR